MNQKIKLGFSLFELTIVMMVTALLIAAISKGSNIVLKSKLLAAQSVTKSSPIPRITNLLVWYETTMEDSFVSSEASQGPISTWYNLNPLLKGTNNTNNALAGNAPTYTEKKINNLPALVFDGASNYLTFDGTAIASSNYTLVIVEQRSNNSSTNYFISGNGTLGSNKVPHFGYRTNTSITFAQFGNDLNASVPAYTYQIPRIHIFRFNSATGKNLYINGTVFINSTTASAKNGLTSYESAQIGRYTTTAYYTGDIGEIAIFNKYINDDERKDIEQYLGKKWGIKIN